jgi:hypothetical protein
MCTEDGIFNNSSNRKTVEEVNKCLPQFNIVPSLALIIKSIDPIYAGSLMVASQQEEILWIFNFECQYKTDSLQ